MHQKIYAITVSKNYSKILDVLIARNADHFEKWYIATQEDDVETIDVIKKANKKNIEIVYYPLDPKKVESHHAKSMLKGPNAKYSIPRWMYPYDKSQRPSKLQAKQLRKLKRRGLVFDKGGAIRQIQKMILPTSDIADEDLVLLLDSDIVLPRNFKEILSNHVVEKNTMSKCLRRDYLFYDDFAKNENAIEYNSFDGAGYFQLYLYSEKKYCKRTFDCGWVDAEFKNQFGESNYIENITVSHLGASDMNWEGKETDSFLFNEELEDFCNISNINYDSSDLQLTRSRIKRHIEATRLSKLQHGNAFPSYFVFGFPRTATKSLINTLDSTDKISIGKLSYNEPLNYFTRDDNFVDEWQESFVRYKSHFPLLLGGNSNWVDYSDTLVDAFEVSLERLHLTFKIRNWWAKTDPVKFLFVVRNPTDRAYSEYNQFLSDFPASSSWNWCLPGFSFEDNINKELESFKNICNSAECGSLLSHGCYFYYINQIVKKLELKKDEYHVVAIEELMNRNDKTCTENFSSFLKIDTLGEISVENETEYEVEMGEELRKKINEFYRPFNEKLFKVMGREIKEWGDE